MSKNYLYLGISIALVAMLSAATFFNFSSKENKPLVANVTENITKVGETITTSTSVNANKKHTDYEVVKDTEAVSPKATVNSDLNYKIFSSSDRSAEFVKENVAILADILDISNSGERDIIASIARRHAENAKKSSDDFNSLLTEASALNSLAIKEGKLSDENKARLASIDAELLHYGEEARKKVIAAQDEIRNVLDPDQQQNLMEYEKGKIVAFRSESVDVILKSFLDRLEGNLSTDQMQAIERIPSRVASQAEIEDYNFGFSFSMFSNSIGKINTGPIFPSSLLDEAFLQLRSVLTSEQIVQSKIDERIY